MSEISLSTMWAKNRFHSMEEFVDKVREFGFTHIEINSAVSPEMLEELIETQEPVSSIHSPCPQALSSTGVWASELSLSSLDKSERKEAIRFAKQTLDLASRVEASAIVLHLGQVPIDFDLEDKLHQLYQRGLAQSKEYKQIKEFLIKERASGVTPYFEAARESLHQLTREGEKRGIALGLETRFYFHEIPNIEEMEELLKELEGELVGCWYDAGHVEVQRRLGFTCHEDWFAHLGSRIIGTHLHDVRQLSDHRAPGSGDMDWGIIAKHLPSGVIKACEIGEWNDEEYVQRALPFLREKGILD